MANKRISELVSLSAARVSPPEDYLHIIDQSTAVTGKNKKITVGALLSGAGGVDPLPYNRKEVFKVHNADVHSSDNLKSLDAPHIWIAPPAGQFANIARMRCWAAGGGGGGGNNLDSPAGGGGAGGFAELLFTYIPGEQFYIYVGKAGHGGAGVTANENGLAGTAGGDTKITSLDGFIVYVEARGGLGGGGGIRAAGGGHGSAGGTGQIGSLLVDGAAGSNKGANNRKGGTGGSAYLGGRGGLGGSGMDAGDARSGSLPGAGGGGGASNSGTSASLANGGNGGHGMVTIEYNNPPALYSSTVHSV